MTIPAPDPKAALAAIALARHVAHGDLLGIHALYTDGADPRLVAAGLAGMLVALLQAYGEDVEQHLAEAAAQVVGW